MCGIQTMSPAKLIGGRRLSESNFKKNEIHRSVMTVQEMK